MMDVSFRPKAVSKLPVCVKATRRGEYYAHSTEKPRCHIQTIHHSLRTTGTGKIWAVGSYTSSEADRLALSLQQPT